MKMVGKMAWFRPADTVLRVPFTPRLRAVVEEEASRLGLKVKVVEGSGVPLKRQITTSDLGLFCTTGESKGGLGHHRCGAVYSGECKPCHQRVDGSQDSWPRRRCIGASLEILKRRQRLLQTWLSTTQMKIITSTTSNSLCSKHITNHCSAKPASPASSTMLKWTSQ